MSDAAPDGWNKARIEALSDGIFAIVMTLHPLAGLATLAVLPVSPTSCFNVFAFAQVAGVFIVTRVARRKNRAPATSAAVPPIS